MEDNKDIYISDEVKIISKNNINYNYSDLIIGIKYKKENSLKDYCERYEYILESIKNSPLLTEKINIVVDEEFYVSIVDFIE